MPIPSDPRNRLKQFGPEYAQLLLRAVDPTLRAPLRVPTASPAEAHSLRRKLYTYISLLRKLSALEPATPDPALQDLLHASDTLMWTIQGNDLLASLRVESWESKAILAALEAPAPRAHALAPTAQEKLLEKLSEIRARKTPQ